jgi:tRNA threonylcarbamoyladenosine biosynthesis protein TsaB
MASMSSHPQESTAPGMILLGIDTCGTTGTLALVRASDLPAPLSDQQPSVSDALLQPGDVPVRELQLLGEAELAGRTTAAMLIPALRSLLAEANVDLAQLSALVVVDGPGSFTGIRIGLSAAKALAEAINLRVFPISRLRVLAHTHSAAGAVLDAGRGEFYLGRYMPEATEAVLTRDELALVVTENPAHTLVACEPKLSVSFPSIRPVSEPTAFEAVSAALPDVLTTGPPDIHTLDGRYIRRSDLYRTAGGS